MQRNVRPPEEINENANRVIRFLEVGSELLSGTEEDNGVGDDILVSPVLKSYIEGQEVEVLIDSGTQCSAVSELFVKKLQVESNELLILPITNMVVSVAVDVKTHRIREHVLLPVIIGGIKFEVSCVIVPKLNKEVILGCDWLIMEKN